MNFDVSHVVVTGGEPMLPKDIVTLTQSMAKSGLHITIETAGTIYRPVQCDLMSISPKMSNSVPSLERAGAWAVRHDQTRQSRNVVNQLINKYDYQLKSVVNGIRDIEEIEAYCEDLDNVEQNKILLMPEGVDEKLLREKEQWLVPICEAKGYTYCPRMHITWYGNKRGT